MSSLNAQSNFAWRSAHAGKSYLTNNSLCMSLITSVVSFRVQACFCASSINVSSLKVKIVWLMLFVGSLLSESWSWERLLLGSLTEELAPVTTGFAPWRGTGIFCIFSNKSCAHIPWSILYEGTLWPWSLAKSLASESSSLSSAPGPI